MTVTSEVDGKKMEHVDGEWRDLVTEGTELEKLTPGKDDTIVIKLDHEAEHGEEEWVVNRIKRIMGQDTKVLVVVPSQAIEVIPRKERHYGVWVSGDGRKDNGGWIEFSNGELFWTTSVGVAKAKLNLLCGDFPGKVVRVFNDDGTPGETV